MENPSTNHNLAIERLIALWAFNEAALGGICHALKIPFTGLTVGGFAVILLCLIAYYAKDRFSTIIRATLIVLLVKAALSPHSSPTAYLAVGFQGLSAAVLFSCLPFYRLSAMLLAVIAMLESACQKLLVMHLLFGQELWASIDAFGEYAASKLAVIGMASLSKSVILAYLGIYLLGGLILGWIGGKAKDWIAEREPDENWQEHLQDDNELFQHKRKKSKYRRTLTLVTGFIVLLLLSLFLPQEQTAVRLFRIVVRVGLILAVWYWLLAPLIVKGIRTLLRKRESSYEKELSQVFDFLPALRLITAKAYEDAGKFPWYKQFHEFLLRMVTYSLRFKD